MASLGACNRSLRHIEAYTPFSLSTLAKGRRHSLKGLPVKLDTSLLWNRPVLPLSDGRGELPKDSNTCQNSVSTSYFSKICHIKSCVIRRGNGPPRECKDLINVSRAHAMKSLVFFLHNSYPRADGIVKNFLEISSAL